MGRFSNVFFLSVIFLGPFMKFSFAQDGHCNHEDTGLYIYNTAHCTFYRCDGAQQVRLKCNRTPHTNTGGNSAAFRVTLNNYCNWAISSKTPLLLELYGTSDYQTATYPGEQSLDEGMLGPAKDLIHKLVIHTRAHSKITKSVWAAMSNLKMLEIDLTEAVSGEALTPTIFQYLNALESLKISVNNVPINFYASIVANLPSLRCLRISGNQFNWDCDLLNFVRKPPFWRMKEPYENPLMECDVTPCGENNGSFCGNPKHHIGKAITAFNYFDCPNVPPVAAQPIGQVALAGSSVSCDFENLRVKLQNVGKTTNLKISLGGQKEPQCQSTIRSGIVSMEAHVTDCGTNVTVNHDTDEVVMRNFVQIKAKSTGNDHLSGHDAVEAVSGVMVPVTCRMTYAGEMTQQLQAPFQLYPAVNWVGQARFQCEVKTLDVLPHTSILGKYSFEIALDTAHRGTWTISVENCWATPTFNASNVQRYDIIKNRCPLDRTLEISEPDQGEQWFRQQFSVQPFQFRGSTTAQVYIHCEVAPCNPENDFCSLLEDHCRPTEITTESTTTATTSETPVPDGSGGLDDAIDVQLNNHKLMGHFQPGTVVVKITNHTMVYMECLRIVYNRITEYGYMNLK